MPSQRECGCLRGESCSECAQPNRGQRVREALNVTVRHSTEVSVEFLRGMAARMCMSFEKYGAVRGAAMGIWRILRCHPFCRGGYDPP